MCYLTYAEYPGGVFQGQVIDACRQLSELRGQPVKLVCLLSIRHFREGRRIIKDLYRNSIVLPMIPKKRWWRLNILLLLPLLLLAGRPACVCRGVFATLLAIRARGWGLFSRVVYDGRGAIAAELDEYYVTPDEYVKKNIRDWERTAVLSADFRNAVSEQLVNYWRDEFGYREDAHVIIPCTINRVFEKIAAERSGTGDSAPAKRGLTYVYSGSVAGWQSLDRICAVLDGILRADVQARAVFYSKTCPPIEDLATRYPDRVERHWIDHEELPERLAQADIGLLVRDSSVTNRVAAPTKFAEYLACGLRVIVSEHLGDYTEFVRRHRCGVVANDTSIDIESLQEAFKSSCNPAALCLEYFTKNSEGVKSAYRKILGRVEFQR